MPRELVTNLISRWKEDAGSAYATWFLWEDRLKNFRSIRRGIAQVAREIAERRFGNAYRGSSLETVVGSVAEQRQIFRGADHAFQWKPKLRIPDIYENDGNQIAFGNLLHVCNCCDTEEAVLGAIHEISKRSIKGLGPAVANLLYFVHPTIVPPFNTAIVKGYNALSGASVRLGRWEHYLAMRRGIIDFNREHRHLLSNDLGATAALLFDVGIGRYAAPPRAADADACAEWLAELEKVRVESAAAESARRRDLDGDRTHTQVQGWLRDLGRELGFAVWVAANDRGRPYANGRLGDGCLAALPPALAAAPGAEAVRLIDVIWIDPATQAAAAAFEVEHSTSIYSGIVRLLDLALGCAGSMGQALFLVAPDGRQAEVRQQLRRPAFSRVSELGIRYVPYGELERERAAIARFGSGLKPLHAISRSIS